MPNTKDGYILDDTPPPTIKNDDLDKYLELLKKKLKDKKKPITINDPLRQ